MQIWSKARNNWYLKILLKTQQQQQQQQQQSLFTVLIFRYKGKMRQKKEL